MALLNSGAIHLHCDAMTVGQLGQTGIIETRRRKGILPLGSYSFDIVRIAHRKEYIHGAMKELHRIEGLQNKQVLKMKSAIASKLIDPPTDTGKATISQLKFDLRANIPHIALSTAISLKDKLHTEISTSDFSIRVEPIDEDDFRVETDISQKFSLSEEETHKLVERAILALGGLNQRIEYMKTYSAISGLRQGELPIFDEKLDFLTRQISSEAQEARFRRVLTITGFPDLGEAIGQQQVDLNKLLEIRETPECVEFREWLHSIDSATDQEIADRFGSLKEKLTSIARGNVGKTVRWVATTALGLIPGAGVIVGPGASFLDTFLTEKVLPKSGPISFLSRLYPSIFKDN